MHSDRNGNVADLSVGNLASRSSKNYAKNFGILNKYECFYLN